MLIAHLPSGFIAGRALESRYSGSMGAALLGSVFPDIDMLYFHFIDAGQTHHHYYATHWPVLYLAFLLAGLALHKSAWIVFAAAALMHLVLDSVAAPIRWLAPFSTLEVEMFTVPATHPNWIVSFVTHWTFAIELSICAVAGWLLLRRRQKTGA